MAHQSPNRLSHDTSVPLIVAQAGKPEGISAADVAELCDISINAAKTRLGAIAYQFKLTRVERKTGLRHLDVRWFAEPDHAEAFKAGRMPGMPEPRSPRQTVELPTTPRPDPHARAGAEEHRRFGSRRGNFVYYDDGTVEAVA